MLGIEVVFAGMIAIVLPVKPVPVPSNVGSIDALFVHQSSHRTWLIAKSEDLVSGGYESSFIYGGQGYVAWNLDGRTVKAPGATGNVSIVESNNSGVITDLLLDPQDVIYRRNGGHHRFNGQIPKGHPKAEIRSGQVLPGATSRYDADWCLDDPQNPCQGACLNDPKAYATSVRWLLQTYRIALSGRGPNVTLTFREAAVLSISNVPREDTGCTDGLMDHYKHVHGEVTAATAQNELYLPKMVPRRAPGSASKTPAEKVLTIHTERCPPPIAYRKKS